MEDILPLVDEHPTSMQTIESNMGGVISHHEAVDIPIDSHGNLEEDCTENQGVMNENELWRQVRPAFDTGLESSNMCCTESSVVSSSESVEGATVKEDLPNPPTSTPVPTTTTYHNLTPPPFIPLDATTQSHMNKKFQTAIKENPTIRLIVDIPPHLVDWSNPITSITTTINPFLSHWKTQNKVNLLAVEIQHRHAYAAIEINNHRYDFMAAHKQTFVFPVYVLKVGRSLRWRFYRAPAEDVRVMNEIKMVHYLHREEVGTPYLVFRIGGREPVFGEPREE
ncbi:hypothetical protein PENFLA_c060G02933 [Penicillium flavigenum]|uniref:Uncharacterized protein n=1 Tax=Penicillium flavigenum TaxID=254877 RepID=A0A1V6SG23_9EURO|nr:hypothetical protein PENFLA_c060G02933 [Penicillium flavigenum]